MITRQALLVMVLHLNIPYLFKEINAIVEAWCTKAKDFSIRSVHRS